MAKENKKAKVLTFKNYHVEPLAMWLLKLSLAGKDSRERTRFIRLLGERIDDARQFKKELQEKYAKKDKAGKTAFQEVKQEIKVTGQDTQEQKTPKQVDFGENKEKVDKEWEEYQQEEFLIDITEGHKSKIYTIADIVLNTSYEFQGGEALLYEEWCEAFENLPNRKEV